MAKVNLSPVSGGYNLAAINTNFTQIAAALNDRVLWRNNVEGEPNQMITDLDMNSKRIYNLPQPVLDHEAARWQDLRVITDLYRNALQLGNNGHWDGENRRINSVARGIAGNDAANVGQVADGDAAVLAAAYVADTNTLNAGKVYADQRDAITLGQAQTYAVTQDDLRQQTAFNYADQKDEVIRAQLSNQIVTGDNALRTQLVQGDNALRKEIRDTNNDLSARITSGDNESRRYADSILVDAVGLEGTFSQVGAGSVPIPWQGWARTKYLTQSWDIEEGEVDQLDKMNAFFQAAAENGWEAELNRNGVYTVRHGLIFPQGLRLNGHGATIRIVGEIPPATGLGGRSFYTAPNCIINGLTISVATETVAMFADRDNEFNDFFMYAEDPLIHAETGGFGISPINTRFHGESLDISRPWGISQYDPLNPQYGEGTRVWLKGRNIIRGLSLSNVDNFTVEELDIAGRHFRAAKDNGHNGILMSTCWNGRFKKLTIKDSGEHLFRVGGGVRADKPFSSGNIVVDDFYGENSLGCFLKLNPGDGTGRIAGFSVGRMVGLNIGEGSNERNTELLRLTSVQDFTCGRIEHRSTTGKRTIAAFQFNDTERCRIESYDVEACQSLVRIADTNTDIASAPVVGVYLGDGVADISGLALELIKPTAVGYVGNIEINGKFTGTYTNLASIASNTFTGPISVNAKTYKDTMPTVIVPSDDRVKWVDIDVTNTEPTSGLVSRSMSKRTVRQAAMSFETQRFDPTNIGTSGLRMVSYPQTNNGVGTYGSSVTMSRPGGFRPGISWAARQFGANETDVGHIWSTSNTNAGQETLNARYALLPNGNLWSMTAGQGLILTGSNGLTGRVTLNSTATGLVVEPFTVSTLP